MYGTTDGSQFQTNHMTHLPFYVENFEFETNIKMGTKLSYVVPIRGEFLGEMYFRVVLPSLYEFKELVYKNNAGFRIIKKAQLLLDKVVVQEFTGEYLKLWSHVHISTNMKKAYDTMVGTSSSGQNSVELFIQLPWMYTTTMKQFFPLGALHNQQVQVDIEFNDLEYVVQNRIKLFGQTKFIQDTKVIGSIINESVVRKKSKMAAFLDIEYINVDKYEKYKLTHQENDYLIEQVELHKEQATLDDQKKIQISFNFPVKCLYILAHEPDNPFLFKGVQDVQFYIGSKRVFFREEVNIKNLRYLTHFYRGKTIPTEQIYMYSMALNSTDGQPSGAINFSKIDDFNIIINGCKNLVIQVYAVGYNVFYTKGGYGSLRFS